VSGTARNMAQRRISKFAAEGQSGVCSNPRIAARAITQLYDAMMRQSGLRATQFSILGTTLLLGPVTVKRLARVTVTDRTTLTRNLKLLEKQGLIRIETGDDRREREVTLTNRGREVLARAHPIWKTAQVKVAKRFGRERLERLLSELSALVEVARVR
jgi:DNA-binding MarR family transcriptional regulator